MLNSCSTLNIKYSIIKPKKGKSINIILNLEAEL